MYSQTSFAVDHSIDFLNTDIAPFDTSYVTAFAFVIDKATNTAVPIVTFVAGQAPNNFDISSDEMETTSKYTFNPGSGPNTIVVPSRMVYIQATRSLFARGLTMCLFLVNWALTIGSIYIMLVAVSEKGKINEAILLLPITIILTIPTLRGLYTGSPPFGIYIGGCRALRFHISVRVLTLLSDTFGFVLQMMTVAVCSIILVYFVAIPKPGTGQYTFHAEGNPKPGQKQQASRADGDTKWVESWNE